MIVSKDGRTAKYEFVEPDDALRKLDEVIGYFTKDRNVKAILKQADRIIERNIPTPENGSKFPETLNGISQPLQMEESLQLKKTSNWRRPQIGDDLI